jgi:uncharacterized protein YdhG (YjbR/CyaY superfamily)
VQVPARIFHGGLIASARNPYTILRVASSRTTTSAPPATVDEYLAALPSDQRTALEKLRRTIRRVIPKGEECISYQMPAFRLDGKVLVWFGAGANHCAFYPGGVVDAHKAVLTAYQTSKGTIRFSPDHPLSASLVGTLIKARIAALGRQSRARKTRGR